MLLARTAVTSRILRTSSQALAAVLAMATQVPYEGSHLETYEVGRRITEAFPVLEAHDMTLEATVSKLMWILGKPGQSWERIRDRFYEPIALDRLVV